MACVTSALHASLAPSQQRAQPARSRVVCSARKTGVALGAAALVHTAPAIAAVEAINQVLGV